VNRRQFLSHLQQATGGLIGASLLGGCQSKSIDQLFSRDLLNSEIALPEHLLTPLSEFYVQSYALPSKVNVAQWQLKIKGAVDRPLTLTFADIEQAPQEDFYLTMECIGNPAGGNLIGNAQWTGTPLLPFLQRAGVKPGATEFALRGNDYYETTLPIAEVMRPEVRLVHKMNQAPLTNEHGYPVRLIVPGHFGQKQPKWLIEIEAITKAKQGYWERQGWSNTAEIPTHSLVRQVQTDRVWNRRHQVNLPKNGETGWAQGILIAGVALDRSTPIQAIELSTDNGQTWQPTEQNHPASPHEWTLWRYRWQPQQPGKYTLLARATSARTTQLLDQKDKMQGQPGALRIEVTLEG
jgi:DMSO/TMAO reductase YedYZ molybdopterin-dependent catalytic subunit